MPKVIVGMSGGVDSAAAAYLLKQAGYDVIGVTLRTWLSPEGEEGRCCEIDDARQTARTIGIPYHVFNCISDFDDKVIKPFISDYLHGFTPNPCVVCNREIKWERLLYYANVLEADYVATGHYASVIRLENGRYTVRKAVHSEKDQTYMLYRLTQEQLKNTLMPLGEYSKQEVRSIAEKAGIQVASKPDSQEICFVTDGDYTDFIRDHTDAELPGEGNFVDEQGNVLGKHKGIIHYTVGQRKKLGIALGRPAYIKKICANSNEIVLSTADDIYCRTVICKDLNFMGISEPEEGEGFRCQVKARYRHPGQYARVEKIGEDLCRILFEEPVRSAAPGQSAVFYDENDCLIGGGVISEVLFDE
ncbi:MAG: tRNA 2-thiouridine(34) synthase MnmA [Clostridiales bacterium]|nr:tRNA 2-thiouridine(34) synthase MnmA [Clostridiales bacterium]